MNKKLVLAVIAGILVGSAATTFAFVGGRKTAVGDNHSQAALNKLKALRGDEFDKAFLEEMIMHHQSAVDMASLINANSKHDELKKLGEDIKSAQSKEIDMMQTWQGDWGYKVAPRSHETHQ